MSGKERRRIVENNLVIWVDRNIDETNQDCQNSLMQLRSVVNAVETCTTTEACIQYLNESNEETAFVISSGALGQRMVPDIHGISKLNAIYIFCPNKDQNEEWAKKWSKIKGIHTSIKSICEALAMGVKESNQNNILVSIITTNEGGFSEDLNQLEPTFMYSHIFKEILLDMKHDQQAIKDLATYCRELYMKNDVETKNINEFEYNYQPSQAISWYTHPKVSSTPFASIREASKFAEEEEILFSMNTIFRIGDIRKLDNNRPLYEVELKLTSDDDQKLRQLTDRIHKEVSGSTGWDQLGQLLLKIGQFDKAEELYTALLEQTLNDNEKAHVYHMLGMLKTCQGQYREAASFYEKSLEIYRKTLPEDDPSLATTYNNIGLVYNEMGDRSQALQFYEKAHKIYEEALPPDDPEFANSYNNIGGVYKDMGDYSKALEFYEKALKIDEKTLPPNHPDLAISYSNIGSILSIVESKHNKPTVLLDAFRYTQDKIFNTTIYWKCENRSCPGRAIQYGSNPPSMKKPHNHDADEMKCKVEEFKMNLKRRIEDSPQPVKKIYREELISLYATAPQITPFTPMFHEIKTSLYTARNASYPPAPRTFDDVNIEGQLSTSDNDHLFFDGTFKSCPNPFYQLYSVHSVNGELSTPKLYTLLPDKKGPTYISIFNIILNLCHMNNICLNPKFVTIDFEQAAINAIKLIFPNAIIKGYEYQDIENIEDFYDYVTNTWIDDDALFDYILWNYYDFKSSTTNNHLEGCHHRLNNDLNNVVHPHFYLFILAIPNDYAYNSPISSRHLATGILPPRKKLFKNDLLCQVLKWVRSLGQYGDENNAFR
ncbi:unnamed protein product [Rotaria sp. Silwood2]|nr:unnamed protein product [Rotaria sp. Silwood2]